MVGTVVYLNFFGRTFKIAKNLLLKLLPASKREKKSFSYLDRGLAAYSTSQYTRALTYCYEGLKVELDIKQRGELLYCIGMCFLNINKQLIALKCFYDAIKFDPTLAKAHYGIGIIYHSQASFAATYQTKKFDEISSVLYDKVEKHWKIAIKLDPDNYNEARSWLILSNRWYENSNF